MKLNTSKNIKDAEKIILELINDQSNKWNSCYDASFWMFEARTEISKVFMMIERALEFHKETLK